MATTFNNTGFPADEYVEFLGKQGSVIDYGSISTARDGLQSAQAKFQIPRAYFSLLPGVKSKHPIFKNLTVETSEISISGVYAVGTCEYFGIAKEESDPVYDMNDNVSEDPIATHPDFLKIAGDAMKPINGANFRQPGINGAAMFNADRSAINAAVARACVFDHFEIGNGMVMNEFAGIESYLVAGITWRKSWCRRKPIIDLSQVGKISVPHGPAPNLNNPLAPKAEQKRNWLLLGISQTQKGACFQCSMEWRASGPRGWIDAIYGIPKPAKK